MDLASDDLQYPRKYLGHLLELDARWPTSTMKSACLFLIVANAVAVAVGKFKLLPQINRYRAHCCAGFELVLELEWARIFRGYLIYLQASK